MTGFLNQVRDEITTLVSESLGQAESVRSDDEFALLIARYLERPSSLVRPALLRLAALAYESRSDPPSEALVALAASTEILHIFALVHDDRIDGDLPPRSDPDASASHRILAGDLLAAVGYTHLGATVSLYQLDGAILRVVRDVASRTVAGQLADLHYLDRSPSGPLSFDRLYRLYDAKTGWYTVAAPLVIGALAGGAGKDEEPALCHIALPLGRAYQLRDDLRDLERLLHRSVTDVPPEFPRWELNLAETWLDSQGMGGDRSRSPNEAWSSIRRNVDLVLLRESVSARIESLIEEAHNRASGLSLPGTRGFSLVMRTIESLGLSGK
jgi:geranylgeranyl pyrophosphate synthase